MDVKNLTFTRQYSSIQGKIITVNSDIPLFLLGDTRNEILNPSSIGLLLMAINS